MGVGLGSFVDDNAGRTRRSAASPTSPSSRPGLLAVTAMQTAIGESTCPVMGGFKWHRFYFSMAATPLEVGDIVAGQLAFIAFGCCTTCAVFLGVLAALRRARQRRRRRCWRCLVVVLLGLALRGADGRD